MTPQENTQGLQFVVAMQLVLCAQSIQQLLHLTSGMRWLSTLLKVKSISIVCDNSSTYVSYTSFSNWRYLSGFNSTSKIWSQKSVSICHASHGSLVTSINCDIRIVLHPRHSFVVVYVSIEMEACVTAKHDIVHSDFL